jgi:DNA-directed RNA polymerase subunit RPC12/RpoP
VTKPYRPVDTEWSVILEAADANGMIDPKRDRLSLTELRNMEKIGLVYRNKTGAWVRSYLPDPFVPFTCGDCGTWKCLTCGHSRANANRRYAGVHGCPRCGSKKGRMEPTFHRHPQTSVHRPAGHLDFALERITAAMNALEEAGTVVQPASLPGREGTHRYVTAGCCSVVWDRMVRRWRITGPGREPLTGSVVLK